MMMHFFRVTIVAVFILALLLILSCGGDDKSTNSGGTTTFTPKGMIKISAQGKSFVMGSSGGFDNELPIHTVNFTGNFWIDTTEVTQADFDTLMKVTFPAYVTPNWNLSYGVGDNYPAYYVSWSDAVMYCNARSKRDGLDTVYTYTAINGTPGNLCTLEGVAIDYSKSGYRLPTEAEWEYACRGGTTTDFYWSKDFDPYPSTVADTANFDSYAIWYGNSWQYGATDANFGTHQVASKAPNAYDLYDMSGNLFEWCNDWYGDYDSATVSDPTGPDDGDFHCLRGGSWGNHAIFLRSANRTTLYPDYTYYFIGFRAVLPVK
jgi:formylglycine-generating enzyme required for sulfatase activity